MQILQNVEDIVHHALPLKKLKDSFSDLTTARNLILKRVTFCQSRIDVSKCSISYNYITYMYRWHPDVSSEKPMSLGVLLFE
ncbi:hypothetical protein pdam_00019880 [Pocillopora damicornis]|uniref:Uncharacterized protein n=1 Tax=Pocillopora damicornis TaxID=46731 RepID=A0A3M6UFI1_POCDA|nr:hypothetical protein pdam_00019880 [Pocillopora damicornis]